LLVGGGGLIEVLVFFPPTASDAHQRVYIRECKNVTCRNSANSIHLIAYFNNLSWFPIIVGKDRWLLFPLNRYFHMACLRHITSKVTASGSACETNEASTKKLLNVTISFIMTFFSLHIYAILLCTGCEISRSL
jgi:hypothetical protein